MASPYQLTVADPARDLVQPAVEGTRNVLAACARAPHIKRVVVTSSMAAITDEPDSHKVLTEADWNTKSSLTRNPKIAMVSIWVIQNSRPSSLARQR